MSVNQIVHLGKDRRPLAGPPMAFFGALGTITAAASFASTFHWDYVLPVAATFALAAAAAIALFGMRKPNPPASVSYLDVAGALILVGLGAAALLDPAQLLRITGTPA